MPPKVISGGDNPYDIHDAKLSSSATAHESSSVTAHEISNNIDDLSKVNVVEDFYDLLKVLNDPDINEFQYTIEDDEWIVHLK